MTKVLPKHTIKVGFSYLYDNHWNDSARGPQRGSYAFNGRYTTTKPITGHLRYCLCGFSAGRPEFNRQRRLRTTTSRRNISSQYGMYVQDDWKLLPNLTINSGLRYDLQWFGEPLWGQLSLFPVAAEGRRLRQLVPGRLQFRPSFDDSDHPVVPSAFRIMFGYLGQDKNNVAPRFGFAYEVVPNTVVRGAFGIYYNLIPASYAGAPFGDPSFPRLRDLYTACRHQFLPSR